MIFKIIKNTFGFFYKSFLYTSALLFATGISVTLWLWYSIPDAAKIKSCMVTTMYQVHLCPGSANYVPLHQISPFVKKAVLVSEDSLFYQHHGFDWSSLQSSFEQDLEKGKFARGGSTITQQLAKNLFLSKEKSIWRKVKEALITQRIEKTLTKNEILERYLNVVQFGKDIFGIKKAAEFYFHKSPAQLNLIESTFLAFLLPSPERYSVSFHKKQLTRFASRRLEFVMRGLFKAGSVSEADFNAGMSQLPHFPNASMPIPAEESNPALNESASDESSDVGITEGSDATPQFKDSEFENAGEADETPPSKKSLKSNNDKKEDF